MFDLVISNQILWLYVEAVLKAWSTQFHLKAFYHSSSHAVEAGVYPLIQSIPNHLEKPSLTKAFTEK